MCPFLRYLALCLLILASAAGILSAQSAEQELDAELAELDALLAEMDFLLGLSPEESPPQPSRGWLTLETSLAGQWGYTSNALLSSDAAGDSFHQAEGDALLWSGKGDWSGQTYLYGEYRHFHDTARFDPQWQALLFHESRFDHDQWEPIVTAKLVHARQVFDATVTVDEPETETLTIWQPTLSLGLAHTHFAGTTRFDVQATRAAYDVTAENFWGHGLVLSHEVPAGFIGDVRVSMEAQRERYDTKQTRLPNGLPDSSAADFLILDQLEGGVALQRQDRLSGRLTSRLAVDVGREMENGAGYFDREYLSTTLELSWRRGPWALGLEGRGRWIDYEARTANSVNFLATERLWQRQWSREAFVSWTWRQQLELSVRGAMVDLEANDAELTYRVQSLAFRVGWSF